jgi:hypothetical protein
MYNFHKGSEGVGKTSFPCYEVKLTPFALTTTLGARWELRAVPSCPAEVLLWSPWRRVERRCLCRTMVGPCRKEHPGCSSTPVHFLLRSMSHATLSISHTEGIKIQFSWVLETLPASSGEGERERERKRERWKCSWVDGTDQ